MSIYSTTVKYQGTIPKTETRKSASLRQTPPLRPPPGLSYFTKEKNTCFCLPFQAIFYSCGNRFVLLFLDINITGLIFDIDIILYSASVNFNFNLIKIVFCLQLQRRDAAVVLAANVRRNRNRNKYQQQKRKKLNRKM